MMRRYTILLSGFGAHAGRRLSVPAILAGLGLLIPSLASAQELGATGLRDFPADTQQVAYVNMAELRSSPNYFAIHRQLFDRRMDEFEMFLRQIGTDAEKDVDEILLGWRGGKIERENFFGVASGRFDPQHAHDLAADQGVMVVNYHGAELYGFNGAETNSNLYFTFLDETTAAFGRQTDLKALVDLHQGDGPPLDSNPDFVSWENELEAAAPQWGIATGRAAALQAAPWFAGAGSKVPLDPATVMAPIKAVLYRVDWTSGFTAHLSLICQKAENATALAQLITLWKASQQAPPANGSTPLTVPERSRREGQSSLTPLFQSLQAQADGKRVELSASGPVEIVGQIIRGAGGGDE